MDSLLQLYVLAFSLSVFFGVIAQKTEFCPLGGVADFIKEGNDGRYYMYIFAIGIAILGSTLLESFSVLSLDETNPPYRVPEFRWIGYVMGGLILGIGMSLCRGCGMKTMINLGAGDLRAAIAIAGTSLAVYVLLYVDGASNFLFGWINSLTPDIRLVGIEHQDLGSFISYLTGWNIEAWRSILGIGFAAIFIGFAFRSDYFRDRKNNIVGGFFIGSVIVAAYYLSGGQLGESATEISDFLDEPQYGLGLQSFTFIKPMGDTLSVLTHPVLYLVTLGMVMYIGVGIGAFIYSLVSRNFKIQKINFATAPRYFVGGWLVGIGGMLGMGCTFGQGMAGTSTLALGSFINLFFLIFGSYVGIKLQKDYMEDHIIPN